MKFNLSNQNPAQVSVDVLAVSLFENSSLLARLLAKESELRRFNLNPVLQKKAIVEYMKSDL